MSDETATGNLIEAMQAEMNRAREILKMYEEIPQGAFGAMFIRQQIKDAEEAIAKGDLVQMIMCFKDLKTIE